MGRLYALLVGINNYPDPHKLNGCLNDIDSARSYLEETHPDAVVHVLKDHEATRANVIDAFRRHLGQAGSDDVALFEYSGHGATTKAALEFNKFDLDARDEGLVLYDSIGPNEELFDLVDKELAMLVAELAKREPHIALVLDCCHSGSGTRDMDESPALVRTIPGAAHAPRPIESYLEGQYAAMAKEGKLDVPSGRHILLAACDRSQRAKEDGVSHAGYFTSALYDVLRHSGGGLTYADLFVRARAAVRQKIRLNNKEDQDPQFEPVADFDSYAGVFGASANARSQTYLVSHDSGDWRVDCGAIAGMPTDPAHAVKMVLHLDGDAATVAGTARAASVGAQTSVIELDFTPGDAGQRFMAEITSMPEPPMLVAFEGDPAARDSIEAALASNPATNVQLVDPGLDDGFGLVANGSLVTVVQRDSGKQIRTATIAAGSTQWANPILQALRHVAQWHRSLALSNPHPKLDPAKVDFVFAENLPDGGEKLHTGPDIRFETAREGESWQLVRGELRIRNRAGQLLNWVLVRLSGDYAVETENDGQIVPSDAYQTIVFRTKSGAPASPQTNFSIDDDRETIERLKLILSTERVDGFLLALEPLSDTRGAGNAADFAEVQKKVTDDWFTKDLCVRIVPCADAAGTDAAASAAGATTAESKLQA